MPDGVEAGGPREEDLKIRAEQGEPEARVPLDRAVSASFFRRLASKLQDTLDQGHGDDYIRDSIPEILLAAEMEEKDPDSPEVLLYRAEQIEKYAHGRRNSKFREGFSDFKMMQETDRDLEKAKELRKRAEEMNSR